MKFLIRLYAFHLLSLWIVSIILPESFKISGRTENFFLASGILALLNLLLKPILKLLFFPVNVASLGLFSIVINALVFYLLMKFLPSVEVLPWHFSGLTIFQFTLPAVDFNFWGSLVVTSFLVSAISNFLLFLVE